LVAAFQRRGGVEFRVVQVDTSDGHVDF
jgi:hypothetical protein